MAIILKRAYNRPLRHKKTCRLLYSSGLHVFLIYIFTKKC